MLCRKDPLRREISLNREIRIIVAITAIFGFCNGTFAMLFTLYLNYVNISLSIMGAIFSVSGLLAFLVAVILGTQSDVWGRKVVYSASFIWPPFPRFWCQY